MIPGAVDAILAVMLAFCVAMLILGLCAGVAMLILGLCAGAADGKASKLRSREASQPDECVCQALKKRCVSNWN